MSIFTSLAGLFGGKRPVDEPPAPGFEHFGGEPADPRHSRYWRSIPHPDRIAVPTLADYSIGIVDRVHDNKEAIDEATGPFLHPLIDAEADAIAVAVETQYLEQVRAEQGLWADEDAIAYHSRQRAELLRTQLDIADADYRAGRDALLGEPGATPEWDATLTKTRHEPALPVPGSVPSRTPGHGSDVQVPVPAAETGTAATGTTPGSVVDAGQDTGNLEALQDLEEKDEKAA